MNKQEAIEAMKQGKKVQHRYFTPDEWMTMQDGRIFFEDGVDMQAWLFWAHRNSKEWEDGYTLLNKDQGLQECDASKAK